MQTQRPYNRLILQAIGIIAVFSSACGVKLNGTASGCKTGVAQISVADTFIRRDCGCAESAGATFTPGQTLQCTVTHGTVVYFYYPGITQTHYISIASGATGTPQTHYAGETSAVDAITLNSTSATGITFTDSYTGNAGVFIVQ